MCKFCNLLAYLLCRNLNTVRAISKEHEHPVDRYSVMAKWYVNCHFLFNIPDLLISQCCSTIILSTIIWHYNSAPASLEWHIWNVFIVYVGYNNMQLICVHLGPFQVHMKASTSCHIKAAFCIGWKHILNKFCSAIDFGETDACELFPFH